MGYPRFYWYSDQTAGALGPWETHGGTFLKVDIDEPISDLQYSMQRQAVDAVSLSTRRFRYHRKPYIDVRIILERFTDEALARELYSMEAHLQKGGYVGFSADRSKTWLSWIGSPFAETGTEVLAPGTSVVDVNAMPVAGSAGYGNMFKHWESAGAIAANDIVHIDGTLHDFNHEEMKVSSVSLTSSSAYGKITTAASHTGYNRYPYQQGAIMRYRDFWPFLCLPENQVGKPLITHDHRINFTFDATFRYYPGWATLGQKIYDPPPLEEERLGDRAGTLGGGGEGGGGDPRGGATAEKPVGTGDTVYDAIIKY